MHLELLVVTARVLRGGRFEPVRISVPFGSLGQDVMKKLECSYVRLKKNEYMLPRADGPLFVLQRLVEQGYVIASAALNGSWTLVKWADDCDGAQRVAVPSSPLPSLSEFGRGAQNNGHGIDGLLFFQLSEPSTSKSVVSTKRKSAGVIVETVSKFIVEKPIGLWLRHRQLFIANNTRTEINIELMDGSSSLVTIIGPQQVNSIIRMFIDALCSREFHVSSPKATWLCKTANGAKHARIAETKEQTDTHIEFPRMHKYDSGTGVIVGRSPQHIEKALNMMDLDQISVEYVDAATIKSEFLAVANCSQLDQIQKETNTYIHRVFQHGAYYVMIVGRRVSVLVAKMRLTGSATDCLRLDLAE